MEEDRLWKFRRPEWLNSVWVRNSGVYGAGALVRLHSDPLHRRLSLRCEACEACERR